MNNNDDRKDPEASSKQDQLWTWLVILVFGLVIVRVSWICDDAFITFRSIENFVHGYGPVYNVGERVQTFTHPLWMLLLSASYFLLNRVFSLDFPALLAFITLAWSWAFTALSLSLLLRMTRGRVLVFILAVLVLISSRAYTDFVASGLENPLTCALIISFVYLQLKSAEAAGARQSRTRLASSLIAGLVALNRMDTVLIIMPALIYGWYVSNRRKEYTYSVLLGFLPFIAWEIFSLVYYGFPFPNTAYAKLNSGIGAGAYVQQGLLYLVNSISLDPITLCVVFTALALGLTASGKKPWPAISLGIGLYLVYIIRIGGDYMSGRFVNPLIFLSVVMLSGIEIDWERFALPVTAGILFVSLALGRPSFLSDSTYSNQQVDIRAIADERGFRYAEWGLLRISRNTLLPGSPFAGENWRFEKLKEVRISGAIGLEGYTRGPETHILDVMALADPLLARMPAKDKQHWRIGHIERDIPEGYLESLRSGENQIEDPAIHAYYTELSRIVSGSIWDAARWRSIFKAALQTEVVAP